MLRSNDLKCLRHLCMLFCGIPGAKDMLICKSARHLQRLGTQLVSNHLRDKSTVEMVDDLILLKIKWDKIVKEVFSCCHYADDCCKQLHKCNEKCGEGAGVDREFERMVDSSFGIFLNQDEGMPTHLATYLDQQIKQAPHEA